MSFSLHVLLTTTCSILSSRPAQFAPTSAPEFSSEKDSAMHIANIIGKPKTGDADVNVRKALRFQERVDRLSGGGGRGGAGGRGGRGGARGGGGRGRGKR